MLRFIISCTRYRPGSKNDTSLVITIDSLTIRQDEAGRYCLNDLHKAAGGESKHQPAFFLRRDETKELVSEINSANPQITPVLSLRGFNGGTFVVKELVYSYAMWISPAFNLKVIRAFDTLQTQGVAVAEHAADLLKNPLKYIDVLMGQAKELQAKLEVAQPKADVFDRVIADKRVTVSEFYRCLDGSHIMSEQKVSTGEMSMSKDKNHKNLKGILIEF